MKTSAYLEHNNITVGNLDATIKFLQTALPEFEIRGSGVHNGRKWVHIGTEESYLALNEAVIRYEEAERYSGIGFNHMGVCGERCKSCWRTTCGRRLRTQLSAD